MYVFSETDRSQKEVKLFIPFFIPSNHKHPGQTFAPYNKVGFSSGE